MLASKARMPVVAAAFLALLAAMPASAAVPTDPGDALDTPQGTSHATVEILNDHWTDVEVYAVTEAGRRYRLGFVSSSSMQNFQLPRWLVDARTPFRIKVYSFEHRAGSALAHYLEGVKTRVLTPNAGEEITIWLTSNLSESAIIP